MIECELKYMLTWQEYARLISDFSKYTHQDIQVNYYYDTEDFKMNKQGITCRIREKHGKFTATIKKHGVAENTSLEKSKQVLNEKDIRFFNVPDLKYQGKLETERTYFYATDECVITVDKNTYLNTVDYELEVEYKKGCEKSAQKNLFFFLKVACKTNDENQLNDFCEKRKHAESKSSRFIKKLLNPDTTCQG